MSAAFEAGDRLDLPAIDRLLLLRLGDWADDFGYCWPGTEDLSAKVGVDIRTIRRHLTALESAGLLLRVYGKGGRHRSNLYRILPSILPDDARAPGRARFVARFRLNQDRESGIISERGTGRTLNPDTPDPKLGPSSVRGSSKNHQDPLTTIFSFENRPEEDPIVDPRLPGETPRQYLARLLEEQEQK